MLLHLLSLIIEVSYCVQIEADAYHFSDELPDVLDDYSDTFDPLSHLHHLHQGPTYETREDISLEDTSNQQTNVNDNININANVNDIIQPGFFQSSMRIPPPTSSEGETIDLTFPKDEDFEISKALEASLASEDVLQSRKSIGKFNEKCRNDPRKKQYYSESFNPSANVRSSWSEDPTVLRKHMVHYNVDITLCWIETTTVKENPSDPAWKYVLREYSISFENAAMIPDEHLECPSAVGEVVADEDKSICNTSFTQVITEDTKLSRVVNQTTQSYEGGFRATRTRLIKCAMGSVVSKDITRWLNDPAERRRRLEMTVSPATRTMDDFCGSLEVCDDDVDDEKPPGKNNLPNLSLFSGSEATRNTSCVGAKCRQPISKDELSSNVSEPSSQSDATVLQSINPVETGVVPVKNEPSHSADESSRTSEEMEKTAKKLKKVPEENNLVVQASKESESGRRLRTHTTPPGYGAYTNPMSARNGQARIRTTSRYRRIMPTDQTNLRIFTRKFYNTTTVRPWRREFDPNIGPRGYPVEPTRRIQTTTRRQTIRPRERNGWHTLSFWRKLEETGEGERGLTPPTTHLTFGIPTISPKYRNGYGWHNRRELTDKSDQLTHLPDIKTQPSAKNYELSEDDSSASDNLSNNRRRSSSTRQYSPTWPAGSNAVDAHGRPRVPSTARPYSPTWPSRSRSGRMKITDDDPWKLDIPDRRGFSSKTMPPTRRSTTWPPTRGQGQAYQHPIMLVDNNRPTAEKRGDPRRYYSRASTMRQRLRRPTLMSTTTLQPIFFNGQIFGKLPSDTRRQGLTDRAQQTTRRFTRLPIFQNGFVTKGQRNLNECLGCPEDDDDDASEPCDCSVEAVDNEENQDQDEIMSLRVQVTLEHIGDDNKIQKLVGVDRNLTVDNQYKSEDPNHTLQWKLQALNQSANKLKTIRDLLNCSILEDIYNGINGVYYAQNERSRSQRAVNCTGIDVGNSDDEVIKQCLPGIQKDLQIGFHQVISNLTKIEPESRIMASPVKNGAIVPLTGKQRRRRRRRRKRSVDAQTAGKIGYWSKERFTRSLDGGQLHTVTRLSLHRNFNDK